MNDFQLEFDTLSNRVSGLSSKCLLDCLFSGLRVDIQKEMALLHPSSISQAFTLAKWVESKLANLWVLIRPPAQAAVPVRHFPPAATPAAAFPPATTPPLPCAALPIHRLSPAEMQAHRAKGLCFNYEEQFHRGHRYKPKFFLLFSSLLASQPVDYFHLSTDAYAGSVSPWTLRLQVLILGHFYSVLVDSESSHNIMQPRVASFLQLKVWPIPSFSVTVDNDATLSCMGLCSNVAISLQGHSFSLPFYLLPIQVADLVLGVQWLQTLGPFLSNFTVPSMHFYHNGALVTLQGNSDTQPTLAFYHQLTCLLFTNSIASIHAIAITTPTAIPTIYFSASK
ncbi:hypothetical protein Salat_2497800 [Sesamum alatum]|uniref:Uncharacterized protein n=1 Tax=Sesamum alatum TaxID=300844 RepID=A0AAE1XRK4_9LAMI|nr:hypothetical protein Salat_2497800 [Sesamum alatum]